jgi:hypothetical protein
MRTAVWLLGAVLAGLALGVATTLGDLRRAGWPAQDLVSSKARDERLRSNPYYDPTAPHPRAIAEERTFDFGQMERGATLSHTFTIRNEGELPLRLAKGTTSCKCTLSGLNKQMLAPGETAGVTLEWTADTEQPAFRQTATIETNDPGRPRLQFEVTGRVVQQIRLTPEQIVVTKIAGEAKSFQVCLTSVNFGDLQIVGYSLEDVSTAGYFDVSYRPMTAEELKSNDDTGIAPRGGSLITVTIKPGLPLGPIRQRIRLRTNLEQRPEVTLPVIGSVEGDISVAGGPEWNREVMMLSLGVLGRDKVVTRELKLLVRGPQAGRVTFQVVKVVPEAIRVHLGESRELAAGRVQQVPLVIEIPGGLPPMSYMGQDERSFGEIVLSTTHREIPQLRLRIRFAVQ